MKITASGPDDLIAALPHVLGFHPEESMMLVPTTSGLPVARIDLPRQLPTYLSIEDAAVLLSVSMKTIRWRIADGTIPAYQCGNRAIRIHLTDLEGALARVPHAG